MQIDDIITLSDDIKVRYSNILKNSYKPDPWGNFFIKKADKPEEAPEYLSTDKKIFRAEAVLPYTIEFNPEKLI